MGVAVFGCAFFLAWGPVRTRAHGRYKHMHNKMFRYAVCLTALLVLAFGCAKAPQEQVTTVRSVLDSVQVAEVEKYAPDQYKAAQDSLNAAMAEIEKQNSKFALTRKYTKAEAQLASAAELARASAQQAVANKARIKAEAEDMMTQMTAAIAEAKTLIQQAPRGKEGAAALESIKNDVAAVEMASTEVANAMAKEDFIGAREMAKAGLEKIQAINEELKAAIEKKMGAKKAG
jgi:hypothetical protein